MLSFSMLESLSLPISYLLQDYTVKELEACKDKNGFGLMEWAIAQLNFQKVNELIKYGFSFEQKILSNKIPAQMIKGINKESHLFFTDGGMTPLHLLVYIFKSYTDIINADNKGTFDFKVGKSKIVSFFEKLNTKNFFLKDSSNFTITDYCFLLETYELLFLIQEKDSIFNSLNKINHHTALNITLDFKEFKNDSNNFNFDNIIHKLNICHNKNELEKSLPLKQHSKIIDKL